MTRKEKATEYLLTRNYVSKDTIKHHFSTTKEIAQEIFDICKEKETQGILVDPRPLRVKSQTVFDVMEIDYQFTLNQFKEGRTINE